MRFDRQRFFDSYTALFSAPSQGQREGLDALLTAIEADPDITDVRWLAYMLATVKHECADRWKAIEEYSKGKGRKYGEPVTVTDPEGRSYTHVYYGRGFVQLTWDYNYRNMGKVLGNRLLYEPSLALDSGVAYRIMSYGMRHGSFTGKKLGDYITGEKCDYVNARRIINGTDQADRIAGYATKLEKALRDSAVAALPGVPVVATPAAPAPSAPGGLFTVAASSLNLRSGPDKAHAPVAGSPVPGGTVVRGLEDQGEWKRVAVQGTVNGVSGITGWASAQYLQPAAAPAPAPQPAPARFTVSASSLNVRSGPDKTSSPVAGSPIPAGTVVQGLEDRGEWKRVAVQGAVNGVSGVTGWVAAQYLQPAVAAHA